LKIKEEIRKYEKLENEFFNDLIKSYVELKDYKESIAEFDIFPKELITKMHKVINGNPIEDIMYDLDKFQQKYLRP
jgi:hypothetical protein